MIIIIICILVFILPVTVYILLKKSGALLDESDTDESKENSVMEDSWGVRLEKHSKKKQKELDESRLKTYKMILFDAFESKNITSEEYKLFSTLVDKNIIFYFDHHKNNRNYINAILKIPFMEFETIASNNLERSDVFALLGTCAVYNKAEVPYLIEDLIVRLKQMGTSEFFKYGNVEGLIFEKEKSKSMTKEQRNEIVLDTIKLLDKFDVKNDVDQMNKILRIIKENTILITLMRHRIKTDDIYFIIKTYYFNRVKWDINFWLERIMDNDSIINKPEIIHIILRIDTIGLLRDNIMTRELLKDDSKIYNTIINKMKSIGEYATSETLTLNLIYKIASSDKPFISLFINKVKDMDSSVLTEEWALEKILAFIYTTNYDEDIMDTVDLSVMLEKGMIYLRQFATREALRLFTMSDVRLKDVDRFTEETVLYNENYISEYDITETIGEDALKQFKDMKFAYESGYNFTNLARKFIGFLCTISKTKTTFGYTPSASECKGVVRGGMRNDRVYEPYLNVSEKLKNKYRRQ